MVRCALLLVVVLPLALSSCPAGCRCGHSRSRSSVDCSSGSLTAVPTSLQRDTNILDLSRNRFTELPSSAFSRCGDALQKLVLSYNGISRVDQLAFQGLDHVWWLSLEDNELRSLHADTFQQTPKLWKLILSGNPLQLAEGPLLRASSLRILELSRCGLERLPADAFSQVAGLWTLRLQGNLLTSTGALRGLPELEILDLHANRLAALPPDAFAGLPRLKQLNVSGNPLALPASGPLLNAAGLSFLDLSGSSAPALGPDAFVGLPGLRILKMSDAGLQSVDEQTFANLSQLERLSLDGNLLRALPRAAFSGCAQLLELDLGGNQLAVPADRPLLSCASLTLLDVRGCSMPAVGDRTFSELPALSVLDAGRCGVSAISEGALSQLPDLYELRLADNNLTRLPQGVFSSCQRLAEVVLHGNRGLHLPPFPAAPALERLDVSECGLSGQLPAGAFAACPQLRSLRLDGNQLSGVDGLQQLPPLLRALRLERNPWACDCRLRPLWRWCRQSGSGTMAVRPVTQNEDSRCPEDVSCGSPPGAHWDLLESLRCEGDPESAEEAAGEHDPNLDVEVIRLAGRLSVGAQ